VVVERRILPPMSNVDKYPPGAFCWIELATTDQNAAKDFYGKLFGWSVTDPQGAVFALFQTIPKR
jgi:uncharacterized protein